MLVDNVWKKVWNVSQCLIIYGGSAVLACILPIVNPQYKNFTDMSEGSHSWHLTDLRDPYIITL